MPLKDGQQVVIKNPRALLGTVVEQRPGDKDLPEEQRRYIVLISEQKRLYLPSELEADGDPAPVNSSPNRIAEGESTVFAKGDYVRIKMAPDTRMGTIEDIKSERGRTDYHFLQDQRFHEAVPGFVIEAWVPEDELELCSRPSDEQVNTINALIKAGS